MAVKQISVFVENKPGRLCEVTNILEQNHLDIRALSIADTTNFGILRIIVDDPDKAQAVLKETGMMVSITEVIAVGITDQPGGLAAVLRLLNEEQVAVEYMYAFISREEKTAYVILRVENIEYTTQVLQKHQVPLLTDKDIYEM
ncbi:MAG: ACT domain-containing protein [Oscillospiraceae bacterium]|mgnify:CR=1 FL=1